MSKPKQSADTLETANHKETMLGKLKRLFGAVPAARPASPSSAVPTRAQRRKWFRKRNADASRHDGRREDVMSQRRPRPAAGPVSVRRAEKARASADGNADIPESFGVRETSARPAPPILQTRGADH